jgi:hypothetical protein
LDELPDSDDTALCEHPLALHESRGGGDLERSWWGVRLRIQLIRCRRDLGRSHPAADVHERGRPDHLDVRLDIWIATIRGRLDAELTPVVAQHLREFLDVLPRNRPVETLGSLRALTERGERLP